MTVLLFIVGLVLLVVGAEMLVRGAARLATLVGVSSLVIGLTVVALGTSAPEMAISVSAVLVDQADISIGNVVGSNICNVLLILGISALLVPLSVSKQLIRLDVPIMIGASILAFLLCVDGELSKFDGILLFSGLMFYIVWSVLESRKASTEDSTSEKSVEGEDGGTRVIGQIALVVLGLGLLVWGARLLVDSAVEIAQALGVSELVIGLTVVAFGTSLPEVVTSIVASLRGERDIAVGNVVGSNLFNILGVIGLAGMASPTAIPISDSTLAFDLPIMIAVSVACLPIFFTGGTIERWEGGVFFIYYIIYLVYLFLAASHHDSLADFNFIMLSFIGPLTVITLLVSLVNHNKKENQAPSSG